jgi:hypothetical protein
MLEMNNNQSVSWDEHVILHGSQGEVHRINGGLECNLVGINAWSNTMYLLVSCRT